MYPCRRHELVCLLHSQFIHLSPVFRTLLYGLHLPFTHKTIYCKDICVRIKFIFKNNPHVVEKASSFIRKDFLSVKKCIISQMLLKPVRNRGYFIFNVPKLFFVCFKDRDKTKLD